MLVISISISLFKIVMSVHITYKFNCSVTGVIKYNLACVLPILYARNTLCLKLTAVLLVLLIIIKFLNINVSTHYINCGLSLVLLTYIYMYITVSALLHHCYNI